MGRRNPNGWSYFERNDRIAKPHIIRVYRSDAPRGQPKYKDTAFASKTDAMANTKRLRQQYGKWRPREALGKWLPSWLERATTERKLAPNTVARHAGHIRNDIQGFAIAKVAVEDITVQHVTAWQRELKERLRRTSTGKVTADKIDAMTVLGALKMLRTALRDAQIEGLLAGENPAVVARPPKVTKYIRPDLADPEIRRLFTALHKDEFRALWWTLANLGRREGETLAIRLEDFKPEDGVIEMQHSLTRGNRAYIIGDGKPHSPRATPSIYVVELLLQHIERRTALRLANAHRWTETPYLFTTRVGTPMDKGWVSRRFQRIRKDADVPYLRLHDLRTYCATFLLELTTDLRMVQEYIGWSTLDMAGHYAGVSMGRRAALAEVLDRHIRGFVDGDGEESSVKSSVRGVVETQPSTTELPNSNGESTRNGPDVEPATCGFGVRGSFVPFAISELAETQSSGSAVPESSLDPSSCPVIGCRGRCQDVVPPPYRRSAILLQIQAHPSLGPALRAVERAESSVTVRKQIRVAIAKYLWWCFAHGLDPTFTDERHLRAAFSGGSYSISYSRQLRSYARRFIKEIIDQARPHRIPNRSAIALLQRPEGGLVSTSRTSSLDPLATPQGRSGADYRGSRSVR